MKKLIIKLAMITLVLGITFPQSGIYANGREGFNQHCNWHAVAQLKSEMRKLWIEHVFWTRDFIKSSLGGLEDKDEVLDRLLKNQEDLGEAIKSYYGEDAGSRLTALLKEHIVLAGKLVDAVKTNDKENINKFNAEWYRNADQIAAFLSKANPELNEKELKDSLYMHLKFVTDEVTARMKKDWSGDILAFDEGENHMIKFADTVSRGIKKQFPEKFQCKRKQ